MGDDFLGCLYAALGELKKKQTGSLIKVIILQKILTLM